MAILRASSANADYIIELGAHPGRPAVRSLEFKKADAFLLEGTVEVVGMPELSKTDYARAMLVSLKRSYPELLEEAHAKHKTIWVADVKPRKGVSIANDAFEIALPFAIGAAAANLAAAKLKSRKKKISRRKALVKIKKAAARLALTLGGGALAQAISPPTSAMHVAALKKGNMPQWLADLGIRSGDIVKSAVNEGRSVITIEKAESLIAPLLREQLGRKPVIYIWAGSAHMGMQKLISNPAYRRRVLSEFSPPERFFTSPILNDCIRFEFDAEGNPRATIFGKATEPESGIAARKQRFSPIPKKTWEKRPLSRRDFLRKMAKFRI